MMGTSFAHTPPAWARKLEISLLMHVFAQACDVEPPALRGLTAGQSLKMFREFTAACMEMALEDERTTRYVRERLGQGALDLGRRVRLLLPVGPAGRVELARFLYRGIGIELSGGPDTPLRFGPCSFARRYSPRDCWLMSAFDEGFLRGLWDREQSELRFACRLTEGADCCQARFEDTEHGGGAHASA